jgi:hypothetical protein
MTTPQLSKFAVTLISLLVLLSAIAAAQLKIGSGNTAFADPPVPRPHTTPCVVTLYKGFKFANFNAQSFTYTPPAACPGPWAKVILEANFSVTKGIQYDRTANIWIGPTNIYFGTTSEPDPNDARHWHVERDLTDYSSIFTVAQDGTVDLGNLVNSTYTSSTRWRRINCRPAPPIRSSLSPPDPPEAPSVSTTPPACSNKL